MSETARLMDAIYVHQRRIYDATRKFYLLGRDGLIADLTPAPGARVLEIGCGTARNLIQIARAYPNVACYGVDISREMLAQAQICVTRAKLEPRIHLAMADATSFDPFELFGVRFFDRIVISYALSMIPPWRDVLARGADLLAPGGELHLVDFGDQAGLPASFKSLLGIWLGWFHVTPRATLAAEVEGLAKERGFASRSRSRFRGYAVTAELVKGSPSPSL